MALVNRIIGDCPGCGGKDCYGNVAVSNNQLHRGCLSCKHWDSYSLPELDKKVLYLDQFFHSHAFRGENKNFVEAKERITALARDQILVSPYSNLHEDESLLWTPEQRELLFKFIKQVSVGHRFWPEYHVKQAQIADAFEGFLVQGDVERNIDRALATPQDINRWDDYFWIDVESFKTDPTVLRSSKDESLKMLLEAFDDWANQPSTFNEDVVQELMGGTKAYFKLYSKYRKRIVAGDFKAQLDSPIDATVVESLLGFDNRVYAYEYRFQRIQEFFVSPYYANVPHERISAELFALLRHKLREGAYKDPLKSTRRFKGFMYDVRHIATYAPYCDAMVVDTLMHNWVTDPLVDLTGRHGTRFFSRSNWPAFMDYLDELDSSKSNGLQAALKLVHPENAKSLDWSGSWRCS